MPTHALTNPQKLPPVEDMILIATIARMGSLTATSDKLGINHATVFRRLIAMEQHWGQALFFRDGRQYIPTVVGSLLAESGEQILSIAELTVGQIQQSASELAGSVKLTMPLDVLVSMIAPMIHSFTTSHPDIYLDINTSQQSLNLSKRDADIAIRATKEPPEHLIGKKIAQLNMAVFASPQLLAKHRLPSGQLTEAQWTQLPWVKLNPNDAPSAMRNWVDSHIPSKQIGMQFSDIHALQWAIRQSLGVAIMPTMLGEGLVQISPEIDSCATHLWLLMHPDFRNTPRIKHTYDALAVCLKQFFAAA